MFHSPEHALAIAFAVTELPIEPKNATQKVVEVLREAHGLETLPPLSDLTPHEWHAQAVMTKMLAYRTLSSRPKLWRAVLAEFSPGLDGARAIMAISLELVPSPGGARDRLFTDMLVRRIFRATPSLGQLSAMFSIPKTTVARRERTLIGDIAQWRREAIEQLTDPMIKAGVVTQV